MKRKVYAVTMIAVLLTSLSYANFSMAQVNNVQQWEPNVFEKYYGQTIESGVKGSQDALLYIDLELEDGKIPEALLNLGYSVTVATDWYDFADKLNTGDYGLAVGFNQNLNWGAWKAGLLSALENYIAGGGSVVFNDWRRDNDFALLFQTSFTSNTNQTIMHLNPSIEDGLPNPITLSNPGWTVFSTGLTATGDAQAVATFGNGDDAIVKGNAGRTIILGYLTDAPPAAHRQQLFENLFLEVTSPPPPPAAVPISNWSIYIGLLLIVLFIAVRLRGRIF